MVGLLLEKFFTKDPLGEETPVSIGISTLENLSIKDKVA